MNAYMALTVMWHLGTQSVDALDEEEKVLLINFAQCFLSYWRSIHTSDYDKEELESLGYTEMPEHGESCADVYQVIDEIIIHEVLQKVSQRQRTDHG